MAETASSPHQDLRRVQRLVVQIILLVLASLALVWLLLALHKVILLLAFTVLFCYLVAPLVAFVEASRPLGRWTIRVPRALAIIIVYLLLFDGVVVAIDQLAPVLSDQLGALIDNAPGYARQLDTYGKWLAALPGRYRLPPRWQETLTASLNAGLAGGLQWLQTLAVNTVSLTLYAPWLVLIPVLGFFFLKDARRFSDGLLSSLPQADVRVRVANFLKDVSETLAAYIRAQLIACLLIGVIVGVGLKLLGVSYPLVLGVAAGLLEFVPVVGPAALGVIATLVASFHSWRSAVAVAFFLIILRVLHDYVSYPRLISQGVEIHPVLVILAVLCGAELGGITGIFLGVPVTALLLVCFRHWRDLQIDRGAERGAGMR